jgi:microcompartment protein CcmK/EutM
MLMGKVTGTVTATMKPPSMTGSTLLIVDVVDGKGDVQTPGVVAVDTEGAGVGDMVLLTQGSAARMASGQSSAPVDLAIIAVVDRISV